jgi:hypothetical protein
VIGIEQIQNFWLGLLPGVPAVLAFLLSGYRQRLPRLWRAMRWLCWRDAPAIKNSTHVRACNNSTHQKRKGRRRRPCPRR